MGTTNDDAEKREYDAETDILRNREIGTLDPDEEAAIKYAREQLAKPMTRYQLQRGASGTFTVQRRVTEGVDDWEDHGIPEYWDTMAICTSPYAALNIAKALQELHPDGNIT